MLFHIIEKQEKINANPLLFYSFATRELALREKNHMLLELASSSFLYYAEASAQLGAQQGEEILSFIVPS